MQLNLQIVSKHIPKHNLPMSSPSYLSNKVINNCAKVVSKINI